MEKSTPAEICVKMISLMFWYYKWDSFWWDLTQNLLQCEKFGFFCSLSLAPVIRGRKLMQWIFNKQCLFFLFKANAEYAWEKKRFGWKKECVLLTVLILSVSISNKTRYTESLRFNILKPRKFDTTCISFEVNKHGWFFLVLWVCVVSNDS